MDADSYMNARTGCYDYRAIRYRHAARQLVSLGLSDSHTVVDVGAGWTEFDHVLRTEHDWKGRYIPLDAGISDIDLETWTPYRPVDFYVALDIVEHMHDPSRLVRMMTNTARAVIVSVPNPATCDVFAMDETHHSAPDEVFFERHGFTTSIETFYGGVYSAGRPDAIMATWTDRRST